ncbi:MAG: threonylcarbamoyl-AMP synthase [Planctomycetaceae bacterium]|nr:threonylcarbamoyl-AMP synthase [Planctomycetaceae bacterium]
MTTRVLPVDPLDPEPDAIAAAAGVLRAGGLVAFPTETVYGLGAAALDAGAVERIFLAKGRPATNPVIVHVADLSQLEQVVDVWPESAARLARRFWPGPLSLVLPRRPEVPDVVTAGGATVAVRMPAHPVAAALIRAAGVPIAAPSANRSLRISPTTAEHVLTTLADRIELVLDGGSCPRGIESTVLDLTTDPPTLLRPGLITASELSEILGTRIQLAESGREKRPEPVRSPGLSTRHYAPLAPVECVESSGAARVRQLLAAGHRVGWMGWEGTERVGHGQVEAVAMPRDPAAYALRLYAVLHRFDECGVERIIVEMPPDTEPWRAVRDRLQRAASPA